MSVVPAMSRTLWPAFFLLVACATSPKQAPRSIPSSASKPGPSTAELNFQAAAPREKSGLYTVHEALNDVLAGAWTYLGTTQWPGSNRTRACAFHNGNVFIVDVYCTVTDSHAFRVDVLSPSRGRLRIYAESNGPISQGRRDDYFIFAVESEPPPPADAWASPLSLSMSLAELQRYEALRYEAFLPACYLGVRHGKTHGNCLDALAPASEKFREEHKQFISEPGAAYYQLVRILRKQAQRFGYDPP